MSEIPEDLSGKLNKLGFTNYEARTYLGLLRNNPATGYEISQQVDVPRSVIYTILRKLEAMGIVISIHDKPRRYIPLSPKQLIPLLESDFSKRVSSLREDLFNFNNKPESEGFWNIRGYESLMELCTSLIKESHETIYISAWKREIEQLKKPLFAAKKRGVEIVAFSFTEIDQELGEVFAYGVDEEKLSKFWDRKIIMVTDSKDLVMGSANMDNEQQIIWTQNRAVLTIAVNYIILDITLYGQRKKIDVSDTVMKLMTEKVDHLDQLIEETDRKNNSN
ncbi:MAG: TrmB family transcriptional regulator [Candidatus Marinimicrobia bacterium]|nr:TrmB family transcriptional regulator [Candidatus Neomarinimicrobiota bacterium]